MTAATRLTTRRSVAQAVVLAVVLAVTPALARTPGEVEIGQTLPDAVLRGLNGPNR